MEKLSTSTEINEFEGSEKGNKNYISNFSTLDFNRSNINSNEEYKIKKDLKNLFTVEGLTGKIVNESLEKTKNKLLEYSFLKNKENEKELLTKDNEKELLTKENSHLFEDGKNKIDKEKLEALQFMCGIMDECTHLKNFSIPVGFFFYKTLNSMLVMYFNLNLIHIKNFFSMILN